MVSAATSSAMPGIGPSSITMTCAGAIVAMTAPSFVTSAHPQTEISGVTFGTRSVPMSVSPCSAWS